VSPLAVAGKRLYFAILEKSLTLSMSNSRKMSTRSVGASLGLSLPHVLTPGGWYLKFYFVDPDTVFISVHR